VCDPDYHAPTPVGRICVECDKPVEDGDTGFVLRSSAIEHVFYHRVCFLRTVIPCEMWDAELNTDMPDRWRQHRDEQQHPDLT
jgi:hypothetical protein